MVSVIADTLNELNKLEVDDNQINWEQKKLIDKLLLINKILNDKHGNALEEKEKSRYLDEMLPNLLAYCKKTTLYFTTCPELRVTEANLELLGSTLRRYNMILDRFISKSQQTKKQTLWDKLGNARGIIGGVLYNIIDFTSMIFDNVIQFLGLDKIMGVINRKTKVVYNRDTVDFVESGYLIKPIASLDIAA